MCVRESVCVCVCARVCVCGRQMIACCQLSFPGRRSHFFAAAGKKKNETPEIAPLHTDPLTLTAALSEKHTHTKRQTHTQTLFPCVSSPPDIFNAYDPGSAVCTHLYLQAVTPVFMHVHMCPTFPSVHACVSVCVCVRVHACVCVFPASLRRLCGDS